MLTILLLVNLCADADVFISSCRARWSPWGYFWTAIDQLWSAEVEVETKWQPS